MKKKIGISFTTTNFQYYWNWFAPEDLLDDVELVNLSFEEKNLNDMASCDGFVLTGGVDVHPSLYGGAINYENSPVTHQPERDAFEEKIYRYSQTNNLPMLGICRGLQLINVLEGGKLIQDLSDGNAMHRKTETDKEHLLTVTKDSLLYQITGLSSGIVNSAHHQAIDPQTVGKNLQVNALAHNDQCIEGIEWKDKAGKAFLLAIQWHPERMQDKQTNPFSRKIKERFLQEIRK